MKNWLRDHDDLLGTLLTFIIVVFLCVVFLRAMSQSQY